MPNANSPLARSRYSRIGEVMERIVRMLGPEQHGTVQSFNALYLANPDRLLYCMEELANVLNQQPMVGVNRLDFITQVFEDVETQLSDPERLVEWQVKVRRYRRFHDLVESIKKEEVTHSTSTMIAKIMHEMYVARLKTPVGEVLDS